MSLTLKLGEVFALHYLCFQTCPIVWRWLWPVLPVRQKSMEDLLSRMKRVYSKAVEDDEAAKQKLQEAWEGLKSKAEGVLN